MTGQFALILRTMLLYPAAGALAMFFGFVSWDRATGLLTIDVDAASVVVAALIWGVVSGGTFGWSRFVKSVGGAT